MMKTLLQHVGQPGIRELPPHAKPLPALRRRVSQLATLLGSVLAAVGVGWLGLQVAPTPFSPLPQQQPELTTVPLPEGLPAPVERFYRRLYGERLPVIRSAVISGRAEIRPFGLTLPARFRFIHLAGQGYRHYIEATWFGIPFMKVNERYVDGSASAEMPFGITESGPQQDQGANLGMWSESSWFPVILLTDPRVRWEPVDDVTALLVVPFEASEESYVVRFDPETGLPTFFEAMRYKGSQAQHKTLWLNQFMAWETLEGSLIPTVGAAIWLDDGRPWAVFIVEDIRFNIDVEETIQLKGPW